MSKSPSLSVDESNEDIHGDVVVFVCGLVYKFSTEVLSDRFSDIVWVVIRILFSYVILRNYDGTFTTSGRERFPVWFVDGNSRTSLGHSTYL